MGNASWGVRINGRWRADGSRVGKPTALYRWRFPPEELLQYAGQYVAWSLDGTHILASADTEEELEQKLVATGVDPSQVVGEFFPNAESVLL